MAGNGEFCADVVSKLRGFAAPEVALHAALGPATVDRQDCNVDVQRPEQLDLCFERDAVAAVIYRVPASGHDVAEIICAAGRVAIDGFVRGRHCFDM